MSVRFAAAVLLSQSLTWLSPALAQPTPVGDDFTVAHSTTQPSDPAVASGPNGTFVVVWTGAVSSGTDTSGSSIQARLFDANAQPLGFPFQVNSYTTDDQGAPAVAVDDTGKFLVVWRSMGSPGFDKLFGSIQGQRYASDGQPVNAQFQVNNFTMGHQDNPAVAVDAEGGFVVAWRSDEGGEFTPPESYRVRARRFPPTGPQQFEFEVTEGRVSFHPPLPAVAVNSDGSSFIAWSTGPTIDGRVYDPFGTPMGHVFQVSTQTDNYHWSPSIAAAGENFVVAWQDRFVTSSFGTVRARRYDGFGATIGSEFGVGPKTNEQGPPSVAADPAGNFIVVWQRKGTPGSDEGSDIVGQLYDALGAPVGDEFQVNSDSANDQTGPAIAADHSGTFTAVWKHSGVSVEGRRFVIPTTTSTSTTSTSSTTLPGPVCGNGVVEGNEACDGGACCTVGCALRGPTEPCGIATQVCHEQPICNGREAPCPEIPRLSGEGSTCFNPDDGCVVGSCHQATASCEGQARVCAAESRVLNDGRITKNGRPKVKIVVSCDANQPGDCEAAAFTTSAGPEAAGVLQSDPEGEQITAAVEPSRTRKKKGKRRSLRFRTTLHLTLNARGQELLQKSDLDVSIRVTVRRGGVEHHPPSKFLRLLQLRR